MIRSLQDNIRMLEDDRRELIDEVRISTNIFLLVVYFKMITDK